MDGFLRGNCVLRGNCTLRVVRKFACHFILHHLFINLFLTVDFPSLHPPLKKKTKPNTLVLTRVQIKTKQNRYYNCSGLSLGSGSQSVVQVIIDMTT